MVVRGRVMGRSGLSFACCVLAAQLCAAALSWRDVEASEASWRDVAALSRHRREAARYHASVSLQLTSLRVPWPWPDSGDEERCPPEGFDFAGGDFFADLEYSIDHKNWTTVATLTGCRSIFIHRIYYFLAIIDSVVLYHPHGASLQQMQPGPLDLTRTSLAWARIPKPWRKCCGFG